MRISVNGTPENTDELTVASLILVKTGRLDGIVVEYNGSVLKKVLWDSTYLKENDELELLSFVGGG